jgi:hypothetical protein
MNRQTVIAIVVLALGVLITFANLQDGLRFSFPLMLGVLLLADGALRLAALDEEGTDASSRQPAEGDRRPEPAAER